MSGKSYGAIQVTDEQQQQPESLTSQQEDIDESNPLLSTNNHTSSSSSSSLFNKFQRICKQHWSDLTFDWISPLLALGNDRGQLNVDDLHTLPLPRDCETEVVYNDFLRCWNDELLKKKANGSNTNTGTTNKGDASKSNQANGDANNNNSNDINTLEMEILQSIPSHHQQQHQYQPSLIRALYKAFGTDFLRAGLYKLVHDSNLFVGPMVLNRLIRFLRDDSAPLSTGLVLVTIVTVSQIVMSITLRHYFYKCYTCGLRIRTAVVIAIYQKSFVLSLKERHARGGAGEIANLVGIDASRMQDLMTYLHAVWYSFFQIGLALYFLHDQVGLAMLAGVAVILCLIPSTKAVAAYLGSIQKRLMKARDERVALNNEMLGSMKIIKIQAWEENFKSKLLSLRHVELGTLRHYFFTSAVSVSLYSSTPLLVALATFAAYTLSGNQLDVASALTALSLFDVLRFPLFMLPQIINRIVEAGISFERVREFLLAEEYQSVGEGELKEDGEIWINNGTFVYDSKKPALPEEDEAKKPKTSIGKLRQQNKRMLEEAMLDRQWEIALMKAQLIDAEEKIHALQKVVHPELVCERSSSQIETWSPSSLLSLRRVSMHCKPGDFIAVVGSVGSGKSTLINSLLGEGRPLTGSELAYKGNLGVFLQTPFIMNDTVKNNILFGHLSGSIDEERYQLAVKVCSLAHDLEMLSAGDQTEIGEKGITLSGGQKARVALARAVYHDAEIYLLDDPLAAVDAHVAKDLFHNCIINELLLGKNKKKKGTSVSTDGKRGRNATVILVTNALQYLNHPLVDKIICLDDGCVEEVGTYAELASNPNSKFAAYLSTMAETGKASDGQNPMIEEDENIIVNDDEMSKNGFDTVDEPDVAKIVEPSPPRKKSLSRKLSSTLADEAEVDDGGALMSDEFKERVIGSVSRQVYIDWAKAAGGINVAIFILSLFVFVEALTVASKWWLTHWSQNGGANAFFYLGIYALINFSAIIATWGRLLLFNFSSVRASESIFEHLLNVVLDAPMQFFDTTPIGRIVNRFSKDMYTVDEQLVQSARSYLATMVSVLSTIFVVVSVTPGFLIALIPIGLFYLNQQRFFTMAYRELKRLDSVTRSPIYALLGETLDGVLTIRAYDAQSNLNRRMVNMLEVQQTAYHLTFSAQCWLSVRLEFAGSMIVMATCLVSVLGHGHGVKDAAFAGLAGLAISFALSVTQSLNWTVRMASDVEANMVAVERIQQYFKIQGEAPRVTSEDVALPDWPKRGRIRFIGAKLRYRKGLPLVLKGLHIDIPAQSKVGVVGRTGAGKSTLMVALLRIVELDSGSIEIDGVDIKDVGLKKLRSNIAVIPQDPVLFSGTVRTNLDPFDEFIDGKLYEVLNHVGLYNPIERVPSKSSLSSEDNGGGRTQQHIKSLSDEVSEGGNNFSVGQRQLIVIARAMLTGAHIVIMDEATASVDADTDARIQRVFREEFKHATCITVAHRLNTIMDSDFVLCMDNGVAAEFDKPSALLAKEGGIFKGLVDAAAQE